jgi:hypothetical protein
MLRSGLSSLPTSGRWAGSGSSEDLDTQTGTGNNKNENNGNGFNTCIRKTLTNEH